MQHLILKAHLELFARLGKQENNPDPIVVVKLFAPWSHWSWYVTEFDPQTGTCFGFTKGDYEEWGYFSLPELQSVMGPYGLKIERDLYQKPIPFSQVRR
jgi:Protein of unknown function (DUF2958)